MWWCIISLHSSYKNLYRGVMKVFSHHPQAQTQTHTHPITSPSPGNILIPLTDHQITLQPPSGIWSSYTRRLNTQSLWHLVARSTNKKHHLHTQHYKTNSTSINWFLSYVMSSSLHWGPQKECVCKGHAGCCWLSALKSVQSEWYTMRGLIVCKRAGRINWKISLLSALLFGNYAHKHLWKRNSLDHMLREIS